MKEYRTPEQFKEITDSLLNGNFSIAVKEAVEYGFYGHDLVEALNELVETEYYQRGGRNHIDLLESLVELSEKMAEKRQESENN